MSSILSSKGFPDKMLLHLIIITSVAILADTLAIWAVERVVVAVKAFSELPFAVCNLGCLHLSCALFSFILVALLSHNLLLPYR